MRPSCPPDGEGRCAVIARPRPYLLTLLGISNAFLLFVIIAKGGL